MTRPQSAADGDVPALSSERKRLPGHGLRILVVEDNQSVGDILASALEQEGCATVLTGSCRDVLELARRVRPDLITLDVAHADLRSSDLLRRLQVDPSTRGVPIIALSARAGDLVPPASTQISRVFGEPFYLAEVVSAVLQTLGRR